MASHKMQNLVSKWVDFSKFSQILGQKWLKFKKILEKSDDFVQDLIGRPRGKLGNGEHLSLEASKYKEYDIYVLIIMQHKEHIKSYPETHFYRHNISR